MDDLLTVYGDRRRLEEERRQTITALLEANVRAWKRTQRRARMKVAVFVTASFGAAGSAAGAILRQTVTSPRNPILEWWPVAFGLGSVVVGAIIAFVLLRANAASTDTKVRDMQTQMAIDLAKKVDREVFDIRFSALEKGLEAKFDFIKQTLDGLRRDMEHNRPRGGRENAS